MAQTTWKCHSPESGLRSATTLVLRAAANGRKEKPIAEGGLYKSLPSFSGELATYHDWAFKARRVMLRVDPAFDQILAAVSESDKEVDDACVQDYVPA